LSKIIQRGGLETPNKKTILVLYEFFFPGYKAGGPIQSLVNMMIALQHEYDFKVITTAFDLNETQPYQNIQLNAWNKVQLTNNTPAIEVWYSSTHSLKTNTFKKVILEANPAIIYINGLFTQWFTKPLLLKKAGSLKGMDIVICPRGMLQAGALSVKPFKKKLFLSAFKNATLFKGVRWHATNEEEANDIAKHIHAKANSIVAYNIPKPPVINLTQSNKQENKLRLIYLSLITEKKNLLLLLQILQQCKATIELDIFGPIKDTAYWNLCLAAMQQMPANIKVQYKNDVQPIEVQHTIEQYDAFVSLTKGENFGHALFEAFSCGRPVITSNFTPWKQLQAKQAGWNVDISNKDSIVEVFNQLSNISKNDWNIYCNHGYSVAQQYYQQLNYQQNYSALFN
jgi:glycosyltransferase involved in cell wall biosynthesis